MFSNKTEFKNPRAFGIAALALALSACGGKSTASTTSVEASFSGTSFAASGAFTTNALTVYANGSNAAGCGTTNPQYPNEPCVSVTICSTSDPTNCQTVNDILLDTGSYGLRVFASAITVPLTSVTSGSNTLGECTQFLDGSSEWGPVKYAYVGIAGEPKVGVPIEVIDSNYQNPPSPCTAANSTPDTAPSAVGFNGILGVGLFSQDCGTNCVTDGTAGGYYTCTSDGNCDGRAQVTLNAQVTNPISALPTDNNGVTLVMNSVASGGAASATGTLFAGVGTRGNNAASGTAYQADPTYLEFWTKYAAFSNTTLMGGFLDSGSNTYGFPAPGAGIFVCSDPSYSSWFCGSTAAGGAVVAATATNYGYLNGGFNANAHLATPFNVGNGKAFLTGSNQVSSELATNSGTSSPFFDWGLPFFFGKTVYVGMAGKTATGFSATDAGGATTVSGPFWAYH
jgi:hypothetical protein